MYELQEDRTKIQLAQESAMEYLFRNVESTEKPVAMYLAGQPGAGKSPIVSLLKQENHDSAVVIDIDTLREFHPQHDEVMKKDPELVYKLLDTFAFDVASKIIDKAIMEKKNIVFDGTFGGNYEFIKASVGRMKEAGYSTELSALALNDTFSKIGISFRKEKSIQLLGHGRVVDSAYHDQVYENIPKNIEKSVNNGLFDKCHLYVRDIEHTTTVKSASYNITESKKFMSAFNMERVKMLSRDEFSTLEHYQDRTCSMMKKRGVSDPEIDIFNRYVDYSKMNIIPSAKKSQGISM